MRRPPAPGLGHADRRMRFPRRASIDAVPSGGTTMARTLTCDCGEVLTGQDDEELFRQGASTSRRITRTW
jgi:hypothetical protein